MGYYFSYYYFQRASTSNGQCSCVRRTCRINNWGKAREGWQVSFLGAQYGHIENKSFGAQKDTAIKLQVNCFRCKVSTTGILQIRIRTMRRQVFWAVSFLWNDFESCGQFLRHRKVSGMCFGHQERLIKKKELEIERDQSKYFNVHGNYCKKHDANVIIVSDQDHYLFFMAQFQIG